MKIGTMTPSEFVSGAGMARLRRERSVEQLKKCADNARKKFYGRIAELSSKRMALLVPWWHQRFPTRRLDVIFGNGTQAVTIDGRHVDFLNGCPVDVHTKSDVYGGRTVRLPTAAMQELFDALGDVEDITDGYRDGCPGDLVIEPIKQRRTK